MLFTTENPIKLLIFKKLHKISSQTSKYSLKIIHKYFFYSQLLSSSKKEKKYLPNYDSYFTFFSYI